MRCSRSADLLPQASTSMTLCGGDWPLSRPGRWRRGSEPRGRPLGAQRRHLEHKKSAHHIRMGLKRLCTLPRHSPRCLDSAVYDAFRVFFIVSALMKIRSNTRKSIRGAFQHSETRAKARKLLNSETRFTSCELPRGLTLPKIRVAHGRPYFCSGKWM